MNAVVCLKQVPGTTEVKVDPETNTLVREGIQNVVNPFDTYALEEGVRLRERYGGKVTAVSMGPLQAEEMLREANTIASKATDTDITRLVVDMKCQIDRIKEQVQNVE